jgi:hypothetical protein
MKDDETLDELAERVDLIAEKLAALEKAIFYLLGESRLWNARLIAHDIESAGKKGDKKCY